MMARSSPPKPRSEEHTSELQSHSDLHSFPTRRSSDLIAVGHRNAEVVEELQGLRLGEGAADDDGAEFAAKAFVDLLKETTAETWTRTRFSEGFVDTNERIEDFSFARRKSVESRSQTYLQIFQDQWHETDIGDFVFWKCFADIFGAESAEMHHRGAADEGAEETNHEVDCVIGGKDTQVAKAGSEGIDRGQRDTLLEIILVGHHAAFGAAAGAGGIDDGGDIAAPTRDEGRFAVAAEFFPAMCTKEIDVCWSLRNQNGLEICWRAM